jgi:hypothetical protein
LDTDTRRWEQNSKTAENEKKSGSKSERTELTRNLAQNENEQELTRNLANIRTDKL